MDWDLKSEEEQGPTTPDRKITAWIWDQNVARHTFRKVDVLDRNFWVYTRVVMVNGRWRVRVVASYDPPDRERDSVILASSHTNWDE